MGPVNLRLCLLEDFGECALQPQCLMTQYQSFYAHVWCCRGIQPRVEWVHEMHVIHKDQTISFFILSIAYSMAPSMKQICNLVITMVLFLSLHALARAQNLPLASPSLLPWEKDYSTAVAKAVKEKRPLLAERALTALEAWRGKLA